VFSKVVGLNGFRSERLYRRSTDLYNASVSPQLPRKDGDTMKVIDALVGLFTLGTIAHIYDSESRRRRLQQQPQKSVPQPVEQLPLMGRTESGAFFFQGRIVGHDGASHTDVPTKEEPWNVRPRF
jgi:hypothetical protein